MTAWIERAVLVTSDPWYRLKNLCFVLTLMLTNSRQGLPFIWLCKPGIMSCSWWPRIISASDFGRFWARRHMQPDEEPMCWRGRCENWIPNSLCRVEMLLTNIPAFDLSVRRYSLLLVGLRPDHRKSSCSSAADHPRGLFSTACSNPLMCASVCLSSTLKVSLLWFHELCFKWSFNRVNYWLLSAKIWSA